MSYRDDEDPYEGLDEWCTCNCKQSAHWYKHYPAFTTSYGWCPEEVDYGCKECKDCPNEDNRRCDGCGVWYNIDDLFRTEDLSLYCLECKEGDGV